MDPGLHGLALTIRWRHAATLWFMSGSNLNRVASDPSAKRDADLPPALQQSLTRHRDNLASMVVALRAAGVDEASIESHLSVLMDSYRAELSTALRYLESEA